MSMNGALVHFVLADGPEHVHGQCRPALVVLDNGDSNHILNLIVFRDKGDTTGAKLTLVVPADLMEYEANIPHSTTHEFGSWHLASECSASECRS